MSTIRDIPVPINGLTTLATGRYPGGQLSMSVCDDQVRTGATLTTRFFPEEHPFDGNELVFAKKHAALPALKAAGVIGARPSRTFTSGKAAEEFEVYQFIDVSAPASQQS